VFLSRQSAVLKGLMARSILCRKEWSIDMGKRILVVDDEELLTKSLTNLLEKFGYDVYVAMNAQQGIDMIQEIDFDLIITDVRMPGIDGIGMLEQIRRIRSEKQENKHVPEIVVTGYASDEKEMQARKLNVKAFIYKPFDVKEMLELVREAIGK